ncbi:MAG TPA: T9SS type A sorting domain-containing protein, partial [Flavobacteriales bacterium]|nr:T9SS type A sorting domain-containing protein [Flavobacteriales bacterium]
YQNGDSHEWAYATSDGNGTIHLAFNIGTIETNFYDNLTIYDGADQFAPVLFSHGDASSNLGPAGSAIDGTGYDYETVDVTTTSGSIYMTMSSDGSVSCEDETGFFDAWQFEVTCIGCTTPGVSYNLVADCLHRSYNTEVIVTQAPSPLGLTITNPITNQMQTANNVGVFTFGPYTIDSLSLFNVVDGDTPSCVWVSDSLIYASDSCHIVSCGTDNYNYCYGNNEDRWYTYRSAQNVPTTINFTQGQLLAGDKIVLYNGPNENSTVIYQGTNGGNLTGFAVNSQNPQNIITLRIQSNSVGSCGDGAASPELKWWVACGAVGIDEVEAQSFNVFPNPTEGLLYINVGKEVSGQVKVRVMDLSGRTVIERPLSISPNSNNTIDMTGLQSGQYMVQLTTAQWSKIQRVEVAH